MKTPSFLSPSMGDEKHDEAFEEASLRSALDRLGAPSRARAGTPRPAVDPAQGKRRRFAKDGEVLVEKHSLARTTPRTLAMPRAASTSRAVHFSDEDATEVSRLRRQLADEKLRFEDAERQLETLQTAQRGLETRQAHADMVVRELKSKLAEREEELTEAGRALRSAQRTVETLEEEMQALRKKLEARPRGRPRLKPLEDEQEDEMLVAEADEPQPVKWWKD
ncbi:hypothetical protein AD949_09125 [Acetobacter orleanensis]|nr:hypothetical protein AD949_09125 [Acetobacter orleanensis]PCD80676.1 hypothetical protein CO710_02860 [Acetobacter orleanensis]